MWQTEGDRVIMSKKSVYIYCISDKFYVGKQRWQTQSRSTATAGLTKAARHTNTHTSTHSPGSGE